MAEGNEADGASTADGTGADEEDEEESSVHAERKVKLNDADDSHAFMMLLLSTLKNGVEGHYTRLQMLFQCQKQSAASIDLLVESVELFNVLQVGRRRRGYTGGYIYGWLAWLWMRLVSVRPHMHESMRRNADGTFEGSWH